MEVLGGTMSHAVVCHLCHVDLVANGGKVVVLVELDLVVDHPRADLLVTGPLGTPTRHLLLEEALDLETSLGVPQVEVGLRLLALDHCILLPGGQQRASRRPGETYNLAKYKMSSLLLSV